jgi:hypothetical protein
MARFSPSVRLSAQIPQGPQLLDRSGYTVIPGLVGTHDRLYYTNSIAVQVAGGRIGEPGLFVAEIPYTANVFVNVNPLESMDKMVEAGGVGILSLIDSAQVIDSIKREKRQKHRIRPSEVHGGYTEAKGGDGRFVRFILECFCCG